VVLYFFRPARESAPSGIIIGSAVFAGQLTVVSNTCTHTRDHVRPTSGHLQQQPTSIHSLRAMPPKPENM